MGDRRKQALRVQFDGKLKLEFHGAKITSDVPMDIGINRWRARGRQAGELFPDSSIGRASGC